MYLLISPLWACLSVKGWLLTQQPLTPPHICAGEAEDGKGESTILICWCFSLSDCFLTCFSEQKPVISHAIISQSLILGDTWLHGWFQTDSNLQVYSRSNESEDPRDGRRRKERRRMTGLRDNAAPLKRLEPCILRNDPKQKWLREEELEPF